MEEIAIIVNTNEGSIKSIKSGRSWAWLKTEYDENIKKRKLNVKLTKENVIEIKELLSQGKSQVEIAKQFNIGTATIHQIAKGGLWSDVKTSFDDKISTTSRAKLTEEDVKQIKKLLYEKKLSQKEIAELFNVNRVTITDISSGRSWTSVKNAL